MTSGAPAVKHLRGPSLDPAIAALTGDTLVELLQRAVQRSPEAVALVIRRGKRTERWAYATVLERSRQFASLLAERRVGPGDRVVTWASNDPWLVAVYFGIWMRGALVVPLDLRMQPDVAKRIALRTRPTLAIGGEGVAGELVGSLGLPVLRLDHGALAQLSPARPADVVDVTADMPAEVLFTSGTTSDPKGVVVTHGQLVHSVRAIAGTTGTPRPERVLALIPLSHMYGQMVPLLFGLVSGSQVTFLATLTPSSVAQVLRRDRITALTVVPQLLRLFADGIDAEARRRGNEATLLRLRAIAVRMPWPIRRILFRPVLRRLGPDLAVFTCGGAFLPPELQLAWEAIGIRVVQGYGATECAAIAGHTLASRRPGTVGPPLAGLEVRIAEDGELLARGPNVMRGYWENDAATAEVITDGWVHTGDAATISDGELVILGRTRDRIALPNGLKVYPEDVELALVEAGGIKAAVVLESAPGRIAAVIVPADAEPTTDEDPLEAAVKRANLTLAPHQRVREWRVWPEADLPRTHTLKVRRQQVIDWFRASPGAEVEPGTASRGEGPRAGPTAAPTAPVGPPAAALEERLEGLIVEVLADASGKAPPPIEAATSLEELGLDSLARVSLAMRIEDEFQASLEDQEIADARDLGGLAKLVTSRIGAPPPREPSRWAFSPPARAVRRVIDAAVTGPIVRVIARPSVDGLSNLEELEPPYLICPNHASHLDVPSLRAVLPGRVRERLAVAAAQDYFFEGSPLGPLVALATGAFPFGRTSQVRAALDRLGEFVDDGWSVLVFPEGTRSLDGRMGELKEGIGLLATTLRVPIIPVHIAGTHEILPKGTLLPRRRGRVRVRIGAPVVIDPETSVEEATGMVGAAIASLAPVPPAT